jgi:hypothetical protein
MLPSDMESKQRKERIRIKKYGNQKHSSEKGYLATRSGCIGNCTFNFKFDNSNLIIDIFK